MLYKSSRKLKVDKLACLFKAPDLHIAIFVQVRVVMSPEGHFIIIFLPECAAKWVIYGRAEPCISTGIFDTLTYPVDVLVPDVCASSYYCCGLCLLD